MSHQINFGGLILEIRDGSVVTSDNEVYSLPAQSLEYKLIIYNFTPMALGNFAFTFQNKAFQSAGFAVPKYDRVYAIGKRLYFFFQGQLRVFNNFKLERTISFGNIVYFQNNIAISDEVEMIDLVSFEKFKGSLELKQLKLYLNQDQKTIDQVLQTFDNINLDKIRSNYVLQLEIAQEEFYMDEAEKVAVTQYNQLLYNIYQLQEQTKQLELINDDKLYKKFQIKLNKMKEDFNNDIMVLEDLNRQELQILNQELQRKTKTKK
ncbi:hypothetical protein SS50377_26653 [Spironucleus salmonicida]|uniref:Uncharacterized protein n=1 Tax=Spironucleus salmonicida TaxID=348837 RepID=V6LAQ8_9EUKA|nr:hypothetical protein SS50377_26653 [Spironucleus salmonicida]|eukprot:EST41497.1 Hypothetical protein SS50377_19226 [Spironucleus salmonicida]